MSNDVVKTKTENPDVRAYIYKMVPKELNNNPLFVKVFGKDFARKRLKSNALIVYTNEPVGKMRAGGYHSSSQKAIVLCQSAEDGTLLTPTDIENNPYLKELSIHESIHAILTKTNDECKESNIVYGSGLLRILLVPGTKIRYEIGRGLNEGYTEWLCEKVGHKSYGYHTLKGFVDLLEAAVGTENAIKLGTGNYEEALDMPSEDVNALLSIADSVYKVDDKISLYTGIMESMDRDSKYISDKERERRARLYDEYKPEIESIRNDVAFLSWVKANNKDTSDKSIIEYIDKVRMPNYRESKDLLIVRFESLVLEKYFLQDLYGVFEDNQVDEDNIKKIEKIINLLSTRHIDTKAYDICEGMTAINIIKRFKDLHIKFIKQMAVEEAQKYKDGNLPLRDCIRRIKPYVKDDNYSKVMFINTLCDNIDYSHAGAVKDIIEAAWLSSEEDELFENAASANIYSIRSKNELGDCLITSAIYGKGILYDKYNSEQVVDRTSEERYVFDYTTENDKGYETVIKQFDVLREQIFREHPNAKIHIAQRTIAVDYGEEPEFYYVDDEEIIPMKITKKEKLQVSPGEKETPQEKGIVPIKIRANPISNFVTKIKIKWHNIKTRGEVKIPVNFHDGTPGKISLQVRHQENIVRSHLRDENIDVLTTDRITEDASTHTEQNVNDYNQDR